MAQSRPPKIRLKSWLMGLSAIPWLLLNLPSHVYGQNHPQGLALSVYSSNSSAGLRSSYLLWLPKQQENDSIEDLQLVLPEYFNINPKPSQIKLCYLSRKSHPKPNHSQCIEAIKVLSRFKVGPGRDMVWITVQQILDPDRQLGIAIDLINPAETGIHTIEAYAGTGFTIEPGSRVLGYWLIRIDAADHDD
jgi:hypothetical protein